MELSLRLHFDQTGQNTLNFRDSTVPQFVRPILLILPIKARVKLGQTFRFYITVASEAVESFPVLPPRLENEMIRVHTRVPMAEMRNLRTHRPQIIISIFLGFQFLLENQRRNFIASKTSWTFFSFFTIIGMGKNASIFEHKKAFFTNSLKSILCLGSHFNSFLLNLVGPVKKNCISLQHLFPHLCGSSFVRPLHWSKLLWVLFFFHRGYTSKPTVHQS